MTDARRPRPTEPRATVIETERLILRRPRAEDAEFVFERYASDPEVTRYVGWPRHRELDESRAFLAFSDDEWRRWPAGPYLIFSKAAGKLLGGTGLAFETMERASTGYVLARDAWGRGYATEALLAMVEHAQEVGVIRLYALCHPDHRPSARVLEKGGFEHEATLRRYSSFPNLESGTLSDVLCYTRIFEAP